MRRDIIDKLADWQKSANRKPLILTGARQVGKTWALKEFGKLHFKNTAHIMCEGNKNVQEMFDSTLQPSQLIPFLQAESGIAIEPNKTLIIFDEVQAIPKILTSLKFFAEQAPEFAIAAAGSTLGITLHEDAPFPVGKVDFMHLYPMTFQEFLSAIGDDELSKILDSEDDLGLLNVFYQKLEQYLRLYFYVGGMPEAVKAFVGIDSSGSGDFKKVRAVQNSILSAYNEDFSTHASANQSARLRMLWKSVPSQLVKEHKKFVYGAVRSGARGRDYEASIQWLRDSALINTVSRITAPALPLAAYEDFGAFKLYIHDIGLLGAMAGGSAKAITDANEIYTQFKGALAEQFVAQEFAAAECRAYYWSSNDSKQEVDFIIEGENAAIPIEVKSGKNLASVSFTNFVKKFKSPLAYKLSNMPYKDHGAVKNVPLYLAHKLCNPGVQ